MTIYLLSILVLFSFLGCSFGFNDNNIQITDKKHISLLAIICAFESHHQHLDKILINYLTMCEGGYDVVVVVLTTSTWTLEQASHLEDILFCMRTKSLLQVELRMFDPNIRKNLPRYHREIVKDRLDDFDLFIYQEDDMDLTFGHVNSFVTYTPILDQLSGNYNHANRLSTVGFFRYEITGSNKFLIDIPNPEYQPICLNARLEDNKNIESRWIRDSYNPYQALWILNKKQIKFLEESVKCGFLEAHNQIQIQEERLWPVYMSCFSLYQAHPDVLQGLNIPKEASCGVQKLIPWADGHFDKFGVHHMRQTYVHTERYHLMNGQVVYDNVSRVEVKHLKSEFESLISRNKISLIDESLNCW